MALDGTYGMGWVPDLPDFRDYTPRHPLALEFTSKLAVGLSKKKTSPGAVDLRRWCPAIENQGTLNSCTANAASGIIQYFEIRAQGKSLRPSRLFIYKATRNLLHWNGDTGANVRATIESVVMFGAPPEEYWPYVTKSPDFDEEPAAFCYSFGRNYVALKYIRHDAPGVSDTAEIVRSLKEYLAMGIPSIFGFTVYDSIYQSMTTGQIPFPTPQESKKGGHAVVAVGYDDDRTISNTIDGSHATGALLIRNSWGAQWGDQGYGWLPYDYFLRGVAKDCWSMLQQRWVDPDAFSDQQTRHKK